MSASSSDARDDGFSRIVTVGAPPELLRYVVEKGSIAVDGVSLTVAEIGGDWFSVALIPETLERTTLGTAAPGRPVNLEVDVLAKYVEKLVRTMSRPFASIEAALDDIRAGRMVVVCDDEDRENEGDLTLAAQFATPEAINFMAKEGRGLICLALTPERCDALGLDLMAAKNESPFETAFTVSIEARDGVTTGISAADRARTVQVAIDPGSAPRDLVQPGHIFPLKAKPGGVLERTGQTEAAVDLARLAGLNPAGVICEIMNDDGTMARVRDLERYCARHGLKMITVADLIAYRRKHDRLVERVVATRLPTGVRRVQRGRLPLAGRRQAPRGAGQGRRGGRRRRARPRALRVPDRRRLPLAALRLRRAARIRAGDDRARGPRRAALPGPGGPRHRAAEQAQGLQPAGPAGWTPSTPTSSSACRSTCATTASARRSWPTWACRRSGSSPTTRRRSAAWRATGCRSPRRCRSSTRPNPHNEAYLRAKRDRMGHTLHHQGLALDEQMVHDEQVHDRERDAR